jgi:hypothetical protein
MSVASIWTYVQPRRASSRTSSQRIAVASAKASNGSAYASRDVCGFHHFPIMSGLGRVAFAGPSVRARTYVNSSVAIDRTRRSLSLTECPATVRVRSSVP